MTIAPASLAGAEPFPVPDEVMALAVKDLRMARRALACLLGRNLEGMTQLGDVRLVHPAEDFRIPHMSLWTGEDERAVASTTDDIIALLERRAELRGNGALSWENFRKYLYMNNARVCALVRDLRRRGVSGTVLEVGSLAGSFAIPLARLGYKVTVADRYSSMGGAYDELISWMRELGITVVDTTAETEYTTIPALGRFDAVISMAVIEHIPHTPRLFLEMLRGVTKPGGILALDTPNLVNYWNRMKFAAGESVFAPIAVQYHSPLPFQGHHREYTVEEVEYMLRQIGGTDVHIETFDYNCLQFETLTRNHIDYVLSMLGDPKLAGIILATAVMRGSA